MKIKWFSFIRVTGLIWVLLYHFFVKFFPGGFIGVDIFFTFSGYLITALLIDEFSRKQEIDILGFFKRRFYRIFPPLVLMILIATPLALLVRNDFIASIGNQLTAALGFVTNYFEILLGSSYENQFTPHLFLHTWSLAIEVHFYILWALLLWFFSRKTKTLGQLKGMIFLTSAAVALASFLTMFISSFFVEEFSRIYFSSWTHIFPFFIGASLSTIVGVNNTTKGFKKLVESIQTKTLVSLLSGAYLVLVLLLLLLKFTSIWTYLFGFLLSSLSTATLIYVSRILHERLSDKEEPRFIGFLSDISYGVYLFHWPLYIIFNQLMNHSVAVLLTTVFSIVLATFSFYLLEPSLLGKDGKLFGLTISLKPYSKWIATIGAVFAIATTGIALFAPKIGAFETDLLVNGLNQADTQMKQTLLFAQKGKASSFEITEGTTIIGDSVTLRATAQLQEALPEALIDAKGSRNTQQALEVMQTNIDNSTLLKEVVIATGVNIVYSYQEELQKIIDALPNGHHLILLTPYDGNSASYSDPVAEKHAQYVRKLADQYDFITVADWNTISKENPQIWAGSDYIHFGSDQATTIEGGTLYAQAIKTAIETAQSKPVKNEGKAE
ncbi:acyltransferase family protein [Streptococcus cameli]